mmetsp:Transcript_35617/g.90933  ORF Transcript_35617/g.90933 Transcript_35617/m.90933 type:complete len:406 (+) Transcript_35617:686-1903(+)
MRLSHPVVVLDVLHRIPRQPLLHHQLAAPAGRQLGEDLPEVLGHLLERPLDGLVLAHVQRLHQLLDLDLTALQLLLPLEEVLALLRERHVLVQRLLVHVAELLELLRDLLQHAVQLLGRLAAVLLKRLGRQAAELADALGDVVAALGVLRALRQQRVQNPLLVRRLLLLGLLLRHRRLHRLLQLLSLALLVVNGALHRLLSVGRILQSRRRLGHLPLQPAERCLIGLNVMRVSVVHELLLPPLEVPRQQALQLLLGQLGLQLGALRLGELLLQARDALPQAAEVRLLLRRQLRQKLVAQLDLHGGDLGLLLRHAPLRGLQALARNVQLALLRCHKAALVPALPLEAVRLGLQVAAARLQLLHLAQAAGDLLVHVLQLRAHALLLPLALLQERGDLVQALDGVHPG